MFFGLLLQYPGKCNTGFMFFNMLCIADTSRIYNWDCQSMKNFAIIFLLHRGYSSAGRALAWHARGQRFDPAILHQKSTVLRRKYGAFLFAEADFLGLHCFACTVFRLLQAVSIQPTTFDFSPYSNRTVFRQFFQQAAASSLSMYGVRSKLKVMLS